MDTREAGSDAPRPGMFAGLGNFARNAFGLFATRVELALLELGELRDNLGRLLLVGALALLALWFALACATALVVLLAWNALGWKILLLLAVVYAVACVALFGYLRAVVARGDLSLPATIAELRKDRDALL